MPTKPHNSEETQLEPRLQEWLNRHHVPELLPAEKVEMFEAAWSTSQQKRRSSFWRALNPVHWLQFPTTTFVLGLVLGVFLTFMAMNGQFDPAQTAQAQPDIQIERYGQVQVMRGNSINRIYSNIENPAISVETSQTTQNKKAILHGTVQNGSIQVVWNLN